MKKPISIDQRTARHIWMKAQRIDSRANGFSRIKHTRVNFVHDAIQQIIHHGADAFSMSRLYVEAISSSEGTRPSLANRPWLIRPLRSSGGKGNAQGAGQVVCCRRGAGAAHGAHGVV